MWCRLVSVLSNCSDAVKNVSAFTLDQCFQKVPVCARMWDAMGTHLGGESVVINGTPYAEKVCYLKALEIDPQHANSYSNLGGSDDRW